MVLWVICKYNEPRDACKYFRLRKKRESLHDRLTETSVMVLSSDCVGGRLMKDYLLPCCTPTVNIWFSGEDFLKICEDPQKYLSGAIARGEPGLENHPTGIVDDVVLHFGHERRARKSGGGAARPSRRLWRARMKSAS